MLWAIFALLTGIAVFAVLWPLAKPVRKAASPDIAFYRAKLDEIARDAELGNISPQDAEAAKTEAARQLLAASERDPAGLPLAPSPLRLRLVALAALIFVPVLGLGLYAAIGHPDWPDEPLEARLNAPAEAMDINAAIAKVEAHLAQHPEDGLGYEVLVPAYLQLGRIEDAVHAAQMALEKLGESPQRLTAYGETLVFANHGIVTEEARKLFERAVEPGPAVPKALFFLGLAASQDGDKASARDYWQKLLAQSPPNAPWRSDLEARLASLANQNATPDQAAAIAALPPAERAAAIHAMIDRLAARLAENGQDIEGWLKLVRAYKVVNEVDKARAALATARHDFGSDPVATARIDALAHELGLNS